jgi:hypothetical protein
MKLSVRTRSITSVDLPLQLVTVPLPDWGSACGVNGEILVPQEACSTGGDWQQVDWWLAAFLLLEGWHERLWEERHRVIHSYSSRLQGWDDRAWQHAWVNRIALFLRLWSAENEGIPAERLFGSLPEAEFVMTHDVDAVAKTLPIRIKQGAFSLANALRAAKSGEPRVALAKARQALQFFFGQDNWWTLDNLLDMESRHHLRFRYHFYADCRLKIPKRWLFDPGYDVANLRIRAFLQRLDAAGVEIGLHPSFDSWRLSQPIQQQKAYLEAAAGHPCTSCRQHWLRFSWRDTWAAQEAADLLEDYTLMFNDRPGLRNAAAVAWQPWQSKQGTTHQLTVVPTVIMDSHFYDYQPMNTEKRREAMRHWINECRGVNGQIAVLWHPHTLTKDYGWAQGFEDLLSLIAEKN